MIKKLSKAEKERLKLYEYPTNRYDERNHPNLRNTISSDYNTIDDVVIKNISNRKTTRGKPQVSNRTLVELNHDFCPRDNDEALLKWAKQMAEYMRGGVPKSLPKGVTFKTMYHHSDPRAS